jgi:hypothetical protein
VPFANPFSAGIRAARVNLIPGLLVQVLMVALVLVYYSFTPARTWFQTLAFAKARWGYGFSFSSAVIAGAILPTLLKWITTQRSRFTRADLSLLGFVCLFWGVDGMVIDGFYRLQGLIFGVQPDFAVVLKKVLVDQFIYNPLFAAPYTVACFEFRNRGYDWRQIPSFFTGDFYRRQVVPALCATWAVWIPVTSAIYALPGLLQIPLFALALTFWSMLVTYITSKEPPPEPLASSIVRVVPD